MAENSLVKKYLGFIIVTARFKQYFDIGSDLDCLRSELLSDVLDQLVLDILIDLTLVEYGRITAIQTIL